MDLETEALVQETIRTEFSDCTVVTIAHRISNFENVSPCLNFDNFSNSISLETGYGLLLLIFAPCSDKSLHEIVIVPLPIECILLELRFI